MGQSESIETPEPGDLISTSRGFCEHWAVYVGDGLVVHFAPPFEVTGAGASSEMEIASGKAVVRKEKLSDVVGTNVWIVNNYLDEEFKPRPTDTIVKEALKLVGTEQRYDSTFWNCEHFAKNLRYRLVQFWQSQTPEPGDLIEISRALEYQHWAVYVGGGYVVHLTSPPGVDDSGEKAIVRKEKLKEVLGDNTWRVNNSLDMICEPHPASIIVEEALRQVGKMMAYSVISKNCEHFATKLRYGLAESLQAVRAADASMKKCLPIGLPLAIIVGLSRSRDANGLLLTHAWPRI